MLQVATHLLLTKTKYARVFAGNRETNEEGAMTHCCHSESDIANMMVGNMRTQAYGTFCKLKEVVVLPGKTDFRSWCEKNLHAREQ